MDLFYFVSDNIYFLWEEHVISDCPQFYQYQQSEQPPHTSNNWTEK